MKKFLKKCCDFILNPFKTEDKKEKQLKILSYLYRQAIDNNNHRDAIEYIDEIISIIGETSGLLYDRGFEKMKCMDARQAKEDFEKAKLLTKNKNEIDLIQTRIDECDLIIPNQLMHFSDYSWQKNNQPDNIIEPLEIDSLQQDEISMKK